MAFLTAKFKNAAEAELVSKELEQAGITPNAIVTAPAADSKIALTVSTDADHAATALRIMNVHGSIEDSNPDANWPPGPSAIPADQVNKDRRFVTENRDTSREPQEDRDDAQLIAEAVHRDHPSLYTKPK